ncbi:MAG: hypothetical protein HRT51_15585 [Colwellia sp.]|nr:hypothetical protein [Colwellia sp.]
MPVFIILPISILSGCQLLADSNSDKIALNNNNIELSQYYLWIKSLNDDELSQEISQQKIDKQSGYDKAELQLIMLYSLPNSLIHNPYTAKTLLNDYPFPPYDDTSLNTADLAFIVMLKDQLNQQLLLLEQLVNYKGAYQQAKKLNTAHQLNINQLKKQIIQLKKIEKTLSKRGH